MYLRYGKHKGRNAITVTAHPWQLTINIVMADNYLEKRYDEYLERKAAAEKAKRKAWKKRMDAYRKRLSGAAPADNTTTNTKKDI